MWLDSPESIGYTDNLMERITASYSYNVLTNENTKIDFSDSTRDRLSTYNQLGQVLTVNAIFYEPL